MAELTTKGITHAIVLIAVSKPSTASPKGASHAATDKLPEPQKGESHQAGKNKLGHSDSFACAGCYTMVCCTHNGDVRMPRPTRRYAQSGDEKPRTFKVGDMFVYRNGETAIVTEIFDRYEGKSKYGPEWTLRFMWTPGKDGDTMYREADYNEIHGQTRTNLFNKLSVGRGPHLYPVKETKQC